jgi:hypothetical protein
VAGRTLVVISYYPSISSFSTREMTRVETGGQRVTVHGGVVDLGSGRTMPIPDWCQEIRVTIARGRVWVAFTVP